MDRGHIEKAMEDCTKDIQHTKKQWHRVHKMTVSARRVLVQEIVSLFEFKPGLVEDSSAILMESPRPTSSTSSTSSSINTTTNTLPFAQRDRSLSLHHHHYHHHSSNNQYRHSSSKFPQQQQQQPQPEDLYICGVTLPARVIDVSSMYIN